MFIPGPFSFNLARSQVIQYTLPVYVDNIIAVMPFKMADDHGVLIRPFKWRVWVGIAFATLAFILLTGLIEWAYNRTSKWWKIIDFTLRCICMDSMDQKSILVANDYNRILSITWIWCSFILFAAYSGMQIIDLCIVERSYF